MRRRRQVLTTNPSRGGTRARRNVPRQAGATTPSGPASPTSAGGNGRAGASTPPERPPTGAPSSSAFGPASAASAPVGSGSSAASAAVGSKLSPGALALAAVDLRVDLAPSRPGRLVLQNPVITASGTFGYGIEYGDVVDVQQLGAICCKGTTLRPRVGNPPPRVTETPAGMLNSIGLQNPGVDAVVEKYAALWATWRVPILVNVAGESIDDFVGVARKLDGVPGVAGLELNISCPNVGKGGLQFAVDADGAHAVTAAVRRATDLPLIVKLSPNVTDVRPIAQAVEEGGADAISAINTLSGLAIDAHIHRPLLGNVYGGLSGPAIRPVGLRVVYEICRTVHIPVIGIGGIASLQDALEYFAVGAVAVQVGTAIFADPEVPLRIADELRAYCAEQRLPGHLPLVGSALPERRGRETRG